MALKRTFRQKLNKKTNKTKRNMARENITEEKIIITFLHMLNTIKLYHWKTHAYSQHIATDTLYTDLNLNIDKFVEIMLGKTGKRVDLTKQKTIPLTDYTNVEQLKRQIEEYKQFLIDMNSNNLIKSMQNNDLLNVRDDMLGIFNKFMYLLTLQ